MSEQRHFEMNKMQWIESFGGNEVALGKAHIWRSTFDEVQK